MRRTPDLPLIIPAPTIATDAMLERLHSHQAFVTLDVKSKR
jgi:hypothetical protein